MMFDVMHQQHQEQINKMKEINKQAHEMAQQSIKQMAEQMAAVYNNLQAAENDNTDPNKKKWQRHQRKKSNASKTASKSDE